jgi:hypothetical protein
MNRLIFITLSTVSIIFSSCYYDVNEELNPTKKNTTCDTLNAKFANDILPILNTNCNSSGCHNNASAGGGYVLDNYNDVKSALDNDSARVVSSITHDNSTNVEYMPKGGGKLSDCEIKKIIIWISSGYPEN